MPEPIERLTAALSDRYRLERELGAGGMATVYLAEDLKHSRQVAIKVLRPDLAQAIGPERFLREVGIAARLSHPHIVGLIDSGEAAGFLYYVMPYVEGISLRQKLAREGELPIPEAVRILRDIADALAHAHRQGVIHRDIKPENVMLVERHALVMDFGVAKALAEGKEEGSSSLTSAGVALGTPAYMAPEQASGEGHVDARADLYAWGIVAYELLAGQPPFVRATPQNTLAAQVTATPEPVTHHRATVPGALAHLVMQCLEKKPADRPQSAEEVLRQLDQVLTPSGGLTPTDTRPYQTAGMRRARQRQLLLGTAVVATLLVIGVLGWWWWQGRGLPIVAERVVIAPFRNETGRSDLGDLGWRLAEEATGVVTREGVTEPVPLATLREQVDTTVPVTTSALQRLSRQTGAELVVSGSYSARGDSVEVRTELLRMPQGTSLYGLPPIAGRAGDPALLSQVADQVALALDLNRDWGDEIAWGREYELPPSLAAYRAFVKAVEDPESGACDRARTLAPTWPFVPFTERCLGDSAFALLEARSDLLPGDRDDVLRRQAAKNWQWERAWQIVQRRVAVAPATYAAAASRLTLLTGRPAEAVGYAQYFDAAFFWDARGEYWGGAHLRLNVAEAYHMLGQYQEQLRIGQDVRTRYPDLQREGMTVEISARAGLGEVAEVDRLVIEAESMDRRGAERVGAMLSRSQWAAMELAAHGQPEAAQRTWLRAAEWHRRRLAAGDTSYFRLYALAEVLLYAGRYEEARSATDTLAARYGGTDLIVGLQGMCDARLGDRDGALAAIARLDSLPAPEAKGSWTLEATKAAIYAALGEQEQAMVLLEEAWAKGDPDLRLHWHRLPDLAPVRDLPAFRRLVGDTRPR